MKLNQRGIITADFMFAMVLILGLSGIMFAISLSLTVASVTQYITFAAARSYMAGNIDEARQEQMAQEKYQELAGNKVFKPLFSGSWFQINSKPDVGDISKIVPGFKDSYQWNEFWGVGTTFTAKILDFRIPFFGATDPNGDGSGKNFKSYMGSYLGREVTVDECQKWVAQRWNYIRKLSVQGGASYSTDSSADNYYPITDNGC